MKNYNELANELFERRDEYNTMKAQKMTKIKKAVSTLSCICLITLLGIGVWQNGVLNRTSNMSNDSGTSSEQKTVSEEPVTSTSIHIPAIELPKTDPTIQADMIGIVVYQGRIYIQAGFLECDNRTKKALTGEYLGTATGTIDEYSTQDDYTQEFSSTIPGDVYTVKGYNKDFRICIPEMYEGCDFIAFYECLNGIDISTGNDLYGTERLNMKNNFTKVMFQDEFDSYQRFKNITDDEWNTFIDIMCEAPFVPYMYTETNNNFFFYPIKDGELNKNAELFSESEVKTMNVYFRMKDGTTVELCLFKSGYISYKNNYRGSYIIQVDKEVIQKIFDSRTN